MNEYQSNLLTKIIGDHLLDPIDTITYIDFQIDALNILFNSSDWHSDPDADHTKSQVGQLAGAMDLERPDRLEVLSLLVGFEVFLDLAPVGDISIENVPPEHYAFYPGPSSKDGRITKWMTSVLIDYYLTGEGLNLNERLGYISLTTIRAQKRSARRADREAKAAERAAKRQARLDQRALRI